MCASRIGEGQPTTQCRQMRPRRRSAGFTLEGVVRRTRNNCPRLAGQLLPDPDSLLRYAAQETLGESLVQGLVANDARNPVRNQRRRHERQNDAMVSASELPL